MLYRVSKQERKFRKIYLFGMTVILFRKIHFSRCRYICAAKLKPPFMYQFQGTRYFHEKLKISILFLNSRLAIPQFFHKIY